MSVRVHAIAKEVNKSSKELIEILTARGYDIKSASASIDNITAQSIIDEFAVEKPIEAQEESKPEAAESVVEKNTKEPSKKAPIVRSKADLDAEKKEKEDAEQKEKAKLLKSEPVQPVPVVSNAPSLPPPPVTRANAPPPPPSTAGKSGVPSPPSPISSDTPVESKEVSNDSATSDDDVVVEGNLILIKPPIVVRDFATFIGLKPFQLISELMEMGIFASMNQTIEEDVARKIAKIKGFELEIRHRGEKVEAAAPKKKVVVDENDEKFLKPRSPVVCILGHVDHGKTTLLDTIRKANVVEGEAGGITQHVGAYQIEHKDQKITFLDTPGHAAFSKIRERGANLTDVSVLVVAADDGFMPQTDEALKFAQRAQGTLVVAINKMDAKGADQEKVKTQMQERSIPSEDWGGEVVTVPISALKGDGVDDLLDMILLQAELMELKANPEAETGGVIVEARQEVGRGPTATVIVQKGTLKIGDAIHCGSVYCKVKAMIDDQGQQVKQAPPSTPVNILGWSGVPDSGGIFARSKNEREARREAEESEQLSKQVVVVPEEEEEGGEPAVTGVDALFAAISRSKSAAYRVILKADVGGSLEALRETLELITSDKVLLEILQSDVGQITKNDIKMANTSGADVIGFNVKMENGVMGDAKHQDVKVFQNSIIYEIIDLVKDNMAELLEPELVEKKTGRAEIRQVFKVSKGRTVAGSMVMEGSIIRNKGARLVRKGKVLAEGKIETLKRFKDDATEVKAGFECGIRLDSFDEYEEGDMIETFEVEKIRPSL
ncbi:translation initiation factor IF-2 [Candidatus Seribacter sulfatis]|uniref:translation initiation factor IF-2 n=1 Tax=Candidatus Seribacter sulfatis TaxID=3381756 RepID=UPI00389A334D